MADETTATSTSAAAALTSGAANDNAGATTAATTTAATETTAATTAPTEPAGLALPGKDATPEQWQEFYGKVAPPKAEDYGLTVREGEDPAFVLEVADTMRKHGLTKEQGLGIQKELEAKALERHTKQETARLAQLDAKNTAEQQALKAELGEQFAPQIELAKRAARQFGGDDKASDIITAIEDKIGYKETMRFFMSIGKGLGEHDAGSTGGKDGQGGERLESSQLFYGSSTKQ